MEHFDPGIFYICKAVNSLGESNAISSANNFKYLPVIGTTLAFCFMLMGKLSNLKFVILIGCWWSNIELGNIFGWPSWWRPRSKICQQHRCGGTVTIDSLSKDFKLLALGWKITVSLIQNAAWFRKNSKSTKGHSEFYRLVLEEGRSRLVERPLNPV